MKFFSPSLAAVPFALVPLGVLLSQVEASAVLGLPVLLVWVVGSVLVTSIAMWMTYRCDPNNRSSQ